MLYIEIFYELDLRNLTDGHLGRQFKISTFWNKTLFQFDRL